MHECPIETRVVSNCSLMKIQVLTQLLFCLSSVVMGEINPRDNEGMTPLHCAAHFARPKHIVLLSEGTSAFIYTHR